MRVTGVPDAACDFLAKACERGESALHLNWTAYNKTPALLHFKSQPALDRLRFTNKPETKDHIFFATADYSFSWLTPPDSFFGKVHTPDETWEPLAFVHRPDKKACVFAAVHNYTLMQADVASPLPEKAARGSYPVAGVEGKPFPCSLRGQDAFLDLRLRKLSWVNHIWICPESLKSLPQWFQVEKLDREGTTSVLVSRREWARYGPFAQPQAADFPTTIVESLRIKFEGIEQSQTGGAKSASPVFIVENVRPSLLIPATLAADRLPAPLLKKDVFAPINPLGRSRAWDSREAVRVLRERPGTAGKTEQTTETLSRRSANGSPVLVVRPGDPASFLLVQCNGFHFEECLAAVEAEASTGTAVVRFHPNPAAKPWTWGPRLTVGMKPCAAGVAQVMLLKNPDPQERRNLAVTVGFQDVSPTTRTLELRSVRVWPFERLSADEMARLTRRQE
jgi:hypothetical protein